MAHGGAPEDSNLPICWNCQQVKPIKEAVKILFQCQEWLFLCFRLQQISLSFSQRVHAPWSKRRYSKRSLSQVSATFAEPQIQRIPKDFNGTVTPTATERSLASNEKIQVADPTIIVSCQNFTASPSILGLEPMGTTST